MAQSRIVNASRNIVFGIMLKAYQILLPFVIRTVMIYYLGMEYVGLNSLFTSVLSVLNLAELGVGSAMVFSMYEPIAKNDTNTICALMKLYKLYYRIIGLVIFVGGLIILPFIPKLIKGSVPGNMNVYILYLLNLGSTVFSYWLFAYKNSLLMAYQRSDIISKIQIFSSSIQYVTQILAIIFIKSYYVFLAITLFIQILNNIITASVSDKMYPDMQPHGILDKVVIKQTNQRVKDLFTAKVGGVVVNSADSIVISAVLGLTSLAIYQNYFYIISAVIGFSTVIYKAVTASIGNSIVTENIEKNYDDFQTITLFCFLIFGICASCFLCLFQPFMKLWAGETNLLSFIMVILFTIYFYVYELMNLFSLFKDAAGIWHEDRFRPLLEAVCNLSLNLVLVHIMGLYGILLSTIISMAFLSLPWLYRNLFKYVFRKSSVEYTKMVFTSFFIVAMIGFIDYIVCSFIPDQGIIVFVIKMVVCINITLIMHLVMFSRFKRFKKVVELFDRATGGKIGIILRKIKLYN